MVEFSELRQKFMMGGTVLSVTMSDFSDWCTFYNIRFDYDGRIESYGQLQVKALDDKVVFEEPPKPTHKEVVKAVNSSPVYYVEPPRSKRKADSTTATTATKKSKITHPQDRVATDVLQQLKTFMANVHKDLEKYAFDMKKNGYDVDVLKHMTRRDISEMAGVVKMLHGHVMKLYIALGI